MAKKKTPPVLEFAVGENVYTLRSDDYASPPFWVAGPYPVEHVLVIKRGVRYSVDYHYCEGDELFVSERTANIAAKALNQKELEDGQED